jgi:hypothetical protein
MIICLAAVLIVQQNQEHAVKYVYFLSYAHTNATGFGFGRAEVSRPTPITTITDIDGIQKDLEAVPNNKKIGASVSILNFQLLRTEE